MGKKEQSISITAKKRSGAIHVFCINPKIL